MSVALTQTADASFPDRGGTGLLVTMTAGAGGACLPFDTGAALALLHVRWMMSPATATGGKVVVCAGFDDAGAETFRVTVSPDTQTIGFKLATGQTLAGSWLDELLWHAVEIALDTVAGVARLWINGVEADSLTATLGALATRTVWFGGVLKDATAVNALHLDEWVVADQYVGPVVVPPAAGDAGDPARWLVLYNATVPDSAAWAQHYRDARGVPYANLLGLELSTDEVIDAAQFAALNGAIEQYLSATGLDQQVMGVLVGFGVPGYVDFGYGELNAVDDLLHVAASVYGVVFNSDAVDALPDRPTKATLGTRRLTARIDAADLASAITLVDRATDIINAGAGDGLDTTIYLDPFAGDSPVLAPITQAMVDWSQSIDRQRLRLPLQLSGPLDSTTSQHFDQVSDDGFFWGWDQAAPPVGFFAEPAGRRLVCAQLTPNEPTATTVRASTSNWIGAPLAAGYAAAIAVSRGVSMSSVPIARPFFETLRRGWTLAEAMYLAKPLLREGFYLVGDPLLRVNLPRAGWDVFGPLASLEELEPQQPTAALRRDEVSLPVSASDGRYVVRSLDAQGRSEAGLTLVSVTNASGVTARGITPPAWPDHDGWPVRVRAGQIELAALWDRSLDAARVSTIELRGEVDGGGETTLATLPVSQRVRFVRQLIAVPMTSARYRWRVTSRDGVVWLSPWSGLVTPHAPLPVSLHVLEVNA